MASCDSALNAIVNFWKEYKDVVSKVGCAAGGGAYGTVTTNPAAALQAYQTCLQTMDKVEEAVRMMEQKYSALIGRTSGLTVGPRLLPLDQWQTGTIPSTFERLFLTAAPMAVDDPILRIRERGGKGKVSVTVCAFDVDRDGESRKKKIRDFEINESKKEKKDRDQHIDIQLQGVENKWISVHIDGKSVANTFRYKIMLDT